MRRSERKKSIKIRGEVKNNYRDAVNPDYGIISKRHRCHVQELYKVRFVGQPYKDAAGVSWVKVHYIGYPVVYDEVKRLDEVTTLG